MVVEDRNGQVGYAPAAFLVVILDTTGEEEESDATKKEQESCTEDNRIGGWIGQEGERRKSYSAAVIYGIMRNSRIYVRDSINRKTEQISTPLAHVFKMSLQEGIVPLEWKEANIIPLFKKGSRNKSVNYRPVSLTSVICKVLETIIRDHMMDFLMKQK